MKKYVIPVMLMAAITFATACGNTQTGTETSMADSMSNSSMTSDSASAMDGSAMNSSASTDTTNMMAADMDFVMTAASGGLMEVELGKLAATNASSASVKEFGKQMVTDHSKVNEELKSIATAKNMTVPTAPNEKHQGHINDLKDKKGADFDKAYMDLMVEDHKEDIELFEREANNGKDTEIKTFAAGKVSTLKHHLEMAQGNKDKMK